MTEKFVVSVVKKYHKGAIKVIMFMTYIHSFEIGYKLFFCHCQFPKT